MKFQFLLFSTAFVTMVQAGLRGSSSTTTTGGSSSSRSLMSSTSSPPSDTTTTTTSDDIPSTPGYNYHVQLSTQGWDAIYPGAGRLKVLDGTQLSNNTALGLAYLELFPGGVRELHWHPYGTEWGYITDGTCRFTLMDNDGHYENGYATKGDIWNFPMGWGHSIQGVDRDVGCKMTLFFNTNFKATTDDISVSEIMSGKVFPKEVIEESIGGAPASVVDTFYQDQVNLSPGTLPAPEWPTSTSPLIHSPVFHTEDGTCANAGWGGYLFEVRDDVFPGATDMSGGFMHLEQDTLRDIHWHPNANEMHYVLSGSLKVGIYAMGGVTVSYTLEAGDLGFVPQGMAHYFEAADGPVDLLLGFDNEFWTTQELSTMFANTPSYITAASLNTTTDVVDEYFPKTTEHSLTLIRPDRLRVRWHVFGDLENAKSTTSKTL